MDKYIEVVVSIFTVSKGNIKTLISYEENDNLPFLVRGKINDSCDIVKKVKEIIKSKTKIEDLDIILSNVYSKNTKMDDKRLLSISYIAITSEMELTLDNVWVDINSIPKVFEYDYKEILEESINKLKDMVLDKKIIKKLFNNSFTMPELQKLTEQVQNTCFDRRNFQRKMLSDKEIVDTGLYRLFEGRKKAKVYKYQ